MKNLYFAYGSNIDKVQMQKRCPGSELIGNGIIDGYRFIINKRGYATLMSTEKDFVPGVVWRLSEDDEHSLDLYEGYKKGIYDKCFRKVRASDGQEFFCLLYIDHCNQVLGPPNQGYMEKIIKGARDCELPANHICLLTSWPAKKNFKAFNKLINQIKSGSNIDNKIDCYKEDVVAKLKSQRDLIFLEAMDEILEDWEDDLNEIDGCSADNFETTMLNAAKDKALDIANTCFAHEISNLVQNCHLLEKFLNKIYVLKSLNNIEQNVIRIYDVGNHRNSSYEIATAGIIITDDPDRAHSEDDRVVVTKHAKILEALWHDFIQLERKQICSVGFSLQLLEEFAEVAESWDEGDGEGLARELLDRIESFVSQRKKELRNAIRRTMDEMTPDDDLEEDDNV